MHLALRIVYSVHNGSSENCLTMFTTLLRSVPVVFMYDLLLIFLLLHVCTQILAYLIMSASSSAATRAYDWISNWGKDEFTEMASASIGVSFLAFVAFAFSALISGYNFFNRNTS